MHIQTRCPWAASAAELDVLYHDIEWGVPSFDDRHLFEMLLLEGAQAGLSWSTILKKREGYRHAFDGFDPERIARYDAAKIAELLADAGIVRNRRKIEATIVNARRYLEVMAYHGSFAVYLWGFIDGKPLQNAWARQDAVPASTPTSDAISGALRRLGFRFVGTTICYAFMQAVGMVNDHTVDCFRHREVADLARHL